MAARRSRQILLQIKAENDSKRAIREAKDDLRSLGREEARVKVDLDEKIVLSKIEKIRERIAKLNAQEASPKVDMQLAGAYASLRRLNLTLDRLKAKRVQIDVDVRHGALERTAAGLGALDRGVQGIGRGFANVFHQVPILGGLLESMLGGALTLASNLGEALGSLVTRGLSNITSLAGPIGSVAGSAVSLGLSFASLAAVGGALVIALNAILGAIVALASALVALAASAAAAVAGLGALAVAFGAALIPVALVGLAIFQRFQAILKAHQAAQQAVAQATQDAKTAEQAHTAALEQRKQAEQTLANTVVDGRRAMAQAAIDERNAELALADSRLSQKSARLGVLDAQKALKDLLTQAGVTGQGLDRLFQQFSDVHVDPTKLSGLLGAVGGAGGDTKKVDPLALAHAILNVQLAQQGVKDAVNQTANAESRLSQATKRRAQFAREGLNAYRPYRQALEAVRRANERVARTQDQASAAQRKYAQALKDLTPTEQGSLARLNSLIDGFKRFAKALTDPIFAAANTVFDKLKGHAGEFEGALRQVGTAFGLVVKAIGAFLTEPATLSAFKTLATGAADLVKQLGARAFVSFLRIMREVAVTALPAVRTAARDVAAWLGRIADKPGQIHRAVRGLVAQFQTWARLAGSVFGLVKDVFVAAAPAGKSLAESMRHTVDHWREWIRANPEKVRKFFHDAVEKAKDIAHQIARVVRWLRDNLPDAAKAAKNAFHAIAHVVSGIYNSIKAIVDLVRGDFKSAINDVKKGSTKDVAGGALKRAGQVAAGPMLLPRAVAKLLGVHLPFASGGMVPGAGSGDRVPIMAEPGEFMLRRSVVRQLSLPVLHALNGGAIPQLAAAGGGGTNIEAHFNVQGHPGHWVDERHLLAIAKMEMESLARKIGSKA